MDIQNLKKGTLTKIVGDSGFSLPDLANKIQGFCLGLRITHWETTGFALHKAAEAIQGDLEELLDTFVESCVGYNEGKRPSFVGTVTKETDPDVLIDYLKSISIKDSSLLNIRDEMLSCVYKYKYLKGLS